MDSPRERIKEQVAQAQAAYEEGAVRARELSEAASRKSREALTYTDQWIHENPWLALGIVAGVGLLVGVLLAESMHEE